MSRYLLVRVDRGSLPFFGGLQGCNGNDPFWYCYSAGPSKTAQKQGMMSFATAPGEDAADQTVEWQVPLATWQGTDSLITRLRRAHPEGIAIDYVNPVQAPSAVRPSRTRRLPTSSEEVGSDDGVSALTLSWELGCGQARW